jgi:hypothetical protein
MSSMTIDQWCDSNNFCRSFYYKLKKSGKAPRTFSAGAARRISDEAAREWQREREAEAQAQQASEAA